MRYAGDMRFTFSSHALERMRERAIPKELIDEALREPTKVSYDANGRTLVKKLYLKKNVKRLLLIAGETHDDTFHIITVIDTSKVKKYL